MDLTHLLNRLENEGEKVVQFFNDLDEAIWTTDIYSDGETWDAHKILAHFVSVERAFQWLIDDIVSGGRGAPPDFDLDRFNNDQVRTLAAKGRYALLEAFQSSRGTTIEQASRYEFDDLQREGNHPWFGQVSVTKLLKLLYRHNQLHMRDIRQHTASRDI